MWYVIDVCVCIYIYIQTWVGRRHPRVALQYEMMMLPLVWEARRRCIEFWVRMMRMEEKRIVRMVALEAWECQRMVKWVEELKDSLEKFWWSSGEARGCFIG